MTLDKPKTKAKAKSQRADKTRAITVAEYNALWDEYQRTQSTKLAAKHAGIHYQTAMKYVTGTGEPKKGFAPLAERWKTVQEERNRIEDLTLVEYRRVEGRTVSKMLDVLRGEFRIAAGDVQARLDAYMRARQECVERGEPLPRGERELTIDKLMGTYDKMARLGEHLLGGADLVFKEAKDPLDMISDEEATAYIERGVIPTILRGGGTEHAKRARERGEK